MIEAEIERIGVLRNPVVSWQEAHGEPPPRARALVRLVLNASQALLVPLDQALSRQRKERLC